MSETDTRSPATKWVDRFNAARSLSDEVAADRPEIALPPNVDLKVHLSTTGKVVFEALDGRGRAYCVLDLDDAGRLGRWLVDLVTPGVRA